MSVEYDEEDYEEGAGPTRLVIAVVVAVVLIGAAFFAGRALAGGGPSTLAEAVEQAQAGDLPCGDTGAAATPDPNATPSANGAPPAGGAGFAVRAICDRGQDTQTGQRTGFAGRGGFGFGPTGTVKSVSGDELTLTGQQGDITVTLGPDTKISKASGATASDLKAGQTVTVQGAGRQQQSAAATSVLITGAAN
jgi:hypothetical protein